VDLHLFFLLKKQVEQASSAVPPRAVRIASHKGRPGDDAAN
jgi:hypothetical protein